MKKIKRINVRRFNREFYSYINDLPLEVYNSRTDKVMFLVVKKDYDPKTYVQEGILKESPKTG
jgi:hypothetical protein